MWGSEVSGLQVHDVRTVDTTSLPLTLGAYVEERLGRLRAALERQREDALNTLEDRAHQVESTLRERLHEIATDAEAERAVLETRLHELARRLDELTAKA